MSSSKRWIDADSDADEAERSILRAGLGSDPPPQLEDEVLRRVLAAALLPAPLHPGAAGPSVGPVAPAPGVAAVAGPTAKAASTLALLGKGFVAGVGVSAAIAAGQHWVFREPPRPAPAETARPVAAPSAPRVARGAPGRSAPPAESTLPAQPLEAKPSAPRSLPKSSEAPRPEPRPGTAEPAVAASRRASQLEEEAALLKSARQHLRQGALAAAFATLETSHQRFSASELEQEREALMIELLYRSGQRAAAAARARAFLQRHPESPHRGQVQQFAE